MVVCEGIRDRNVQFVGQQNDVDPLGRVVHTRTTGVAAYLADRVRDALDLKSRFLRPSLIGRALSSSVSTVDRSEAIQVGYEAVAAVLHGSSGVMATLNRSKQEAYRCSVGTVPLREVAGREKLVPREFIHPDGNMTTELFREYALPLIGEPLTPLARLTGRLV